MPQFPHLVGELQAQTWDLVWSQARRDPYRQIPSAAAINLLPQNPTDLRDFDERTRGTLCPVMTESREQPWPVLTELARV